MEFVWLLFVCLVLYQVDCTSILCEEGFCRNHRFKEGCSTPAHECRINNATHTGLWLPSPTICNCCEYCLPFYGKESHCSAGGPGTGVTVGRCGHGLTCDPQQLTCVRMSSKCHTAQDEYDARHLRGETGALEQRPLCDGKGNYAAFHCVPAHTCFCQSEDGERIFGERLNLGATTMQNMHCGCSRFNYKIRKSISPGVRFPVIGPRCTADGNFHPVQCIGRTCYCVNRITGKIRDEKSINLNQDPISKLPCYNAELDLFPNQSEGKPPYNYTTPCYEHMQAKIDIIKQAEENGFITDFFTTVSECMPDGTYGRVLKTTNGTKICVDDRGHKIEDYEAEPNTENYENMDCKCAKTSFLMAQSNERPICCKNGNFRKIQCRRGQCRCVDSDGRQIGRESADVTTLSCYNPDWKRC
ncbi:hypothetical protein RR48_10161 [Papilio machaon]|uniref:Thyroglobulin type-1 domain-containing protein n=1 Tax=Papilio machaon TaxID=76193 RepID=A0A194R542_PAPMA|nr:hypothetical protein RR48_10161 [Papilio machaon]